MNATTEKATGSDLTPLTDDQAYASEQSAPDEKDEQEDMG